MSISHVDLPDNRRSAARGASRLGPADPGQIVKATVVIRGKQELPEPNPAAPLAIADIEQRYGADPQDLNQVEKTLQGYGLQVTNASAGTRTIEVQGTVAQMEKAFEVQLGKYEDARQGEYRGREGGIRIPAELSGIVKAVLGLDERQVARRRSIVLDAPSAVQPQAPSDLEGRYSFPEGTAANQTIGILEFGGGFWDSDLTIYCQQVAQRPKPNVTVVPVGLQSLSLQEILQLPPQQRENQADASIEVNMDVQVIAGLCPGANISVYFAPFTQKGWINALNKAIHDPNGPKMISISWGSPEDAGGFSTAAIQAINDVLKTAALAGVTVCISSGDDGAGDAVNDGQAHCDFPASCPYVLAVGGTMFPNGGPEVGWWDTPGARTQNNGGGSSSGGRSTVFAAPSWQNVGVVSQRTGQAAGRCVPDVSALSGQPMYSLIFDGKPMPNGGTSASAPLWTALLARIAANLPAGKSVGFLTPQLYTPGPNAQPLGATVCTDITSGTNDDLAFQDPAAQQDFVAVKGYQAGPGYDAVTGWGVPNGRALQVALAGVAAP